MGLQRALSAFEDAPEVTAPLVATPISTGLINETHAVEDARGRAFVLQRVSPVFAPGINDNIRAVTDHLAARGVRSFRVVPCHGKPALDLGEDGRWRLLTRVSGVCLDRPENAGQVFEAGRAVAGFHRALFDFEAALQPIGFPFHETREHFEELALAIRECEGHALHADIERLAASIFDAAEGLALFEGLPRRVIHGDLKFNNLLFEAGLPSEAPRVSGIIDLDTVARMPLAYDWGDAMRSWCNRRREDEPEAELDLELARAAAEGLWTAFDRRPDEAEVASLARGIEVVALELCTRFATDALRETHWAWDASKYERAGEHNRDRALGQWSLYRQADATRAERMRELAG